MNSSSIVNQNPSSIDVVHTAKLANLTISNSNQASFSTQLEKVLGLVSKISELDTTNVEETHHAVAVTNVMRDDEIELNRVLTQEEVLKNAKVTHNGFFVVPAVLEQ